MIPEYTTSQNSELQLWLESRKYELGRFGHLGLLCQKMTEEVPEIIEIYLREKKSIELGSWIYYDDWGKIVRTGDELKKYERDSNPDKDVLLIREKSDGTRIEITRLELKIASGEAETLQKPDYPVFRGNQ